MTDSYTDASGLYEVEHRDIHAEREGFRISELSLSNTQQVPWHYHSNISDTFYVLKGQITVYVREPKETHLLEPGESLVVGAQRPHLVRNTGEGSATFLILQGLGEYDYIPLTTK
ncbi:MAG: cupin domain-containing protein [Gammaproteobacteria bacterium]|nr:cupin domain-containing protein [Gammaproteobacteria bacterium]